MQPRVSPCRRRRLRGSSRREFASLLADGEADASTSSTPLSIVLVQMRAGETFQIHHEFVTECRHGHVSNADLRKALYYAVKGPSATDDTLREVRSASAEQSQTC
jgi:hypothetical protein